MMTLIRVVDFESTGLSPDDALCEVGWTDINIADSGVSIEQPKAWLCNPCRRIPPEAMAVHHITNADVQGKPLPTAALGEMAEGADVFAAHRASFERQFFEGERPWICTWKVAVRLAPKAPGHSNQVLRYWLNLAADPATAMPPHRAGPDSYVTAHLLARMLTKISAEEMIAISSQPALLPYLTFGMHAMKPLDEVPSGYLEWCNQQDFDEDVLFTVRHHLSQRVAT